MRVYNGKNCQICVPMLGTSRMLELGPKSVSPNIVPTKEFLELLTQTFTPEEIALIVAGTFEYNVCANIPLACNFTTTSLDEAIERFQVKSEPSKLDKIIEEEKKEEETTCCSGECNQCNCSSNEQGVEEKVVEETAEPEPATTKKDKKKSKKAE